MEKINLKSPYHVMFDNGRFFLFDKEQIIVFDNDNEFVEYFKNKK